MTRRTAGRIGFLLAGALAALAAGVLTWQPGLRTGDPASAERYIRWAMDWPEDAPAELLAEETADGGRALVFRGGESICGAVWCEEPAAAAVRVQFGLGTEQVFPLDGTPSLVLAPRGWGEQSTAWFEVCDADGSEL